ncbi:MULTISPECIES: hypothetical protein [unclassified Janthinobacterium]|uniref:hypothetical protein n=1 Tax=unclassified Janthinobacterium TaxID=2610881 RepID=UPI00034B41D0|nr:MULTISPECIES: hypothetical protein [unclassified Janthinobacterium]MEC5159780.1 hypothetical protein [Janthinobacterium sp. CG_S6]
MNIKTTLSVLLAGVFSAGLVQAETGVTAELGSTGVGAHLSVPLQANLNVRVGANYLNYSYNANTSDVDYDFKMKLRTVDALLDFFPMNNGFRVSAGLVYNGNKIDAHGKPAGTGTYTINGHTYLATSVGTLDGNVDFRKSAPYLGIGWGNAAAPGKGWGFSSDFGVMFQGSPSTSLKNNHCVAPTQVCTQLAADIVAENAKLTDEASDFKLYPVIRFGASYRF